MGYGECSTNICYIDEHKKRFLKNKNHYVVEPKINTSMPHMSVPQTLSWSASVPNERQLQKPDVEQPQNV